MKQVATGELTPGMAAGAEISDFDGGRKLVAKGVRLTRTQIANINNRGIDSVVVAEEPAGDGNMTETGFLELYSRTFGEVEAAFRRLQEGGVVPVTQMAGIVERGLAPLGEAIGAIEFLYRIRCHSMSTFRHSLDVSIIAGLLGRWCGYEGDDLRDLFLAALLHDIGKVIVPLAILDKAGPLSPEEFSVIKKHALAGYRMVAAERRLGDSVKLGILQHHERLDGSGYPDGLDGAGISAAAKVIAVADVYGAMTSDRPYRARLTPFAVLDTIAEQMYQTLDPQVCLTFLAGMRDRLTGCRVTLSDGRQGKVVGFGSRDDNLTAPVVCLETGGLVDLREAAIRIAGMA